MPGYRVLACVAHSETADALADLGRETGEFEVARTTVSSSEVFRALEDEPDVIALHQDVGPMSAMDLARDLSVRVPDIGLVLLARDVDQPLLDAALRHGFRGIIQLPLTLEEVQSTIVAAGEWTAAVRRRVAGDDDQEEGRAGRMLAVAGGKGGVGTTTVAVHLALAALRGEPSRRVCLIDFDLQTGDVRSLLDLPARRSVADLVGVADDMTGRQLDDSLSQHASGLRVLLPPTEGELGEDVDARAARAILGGLRSRFDVVVVDVGAVMSEASLVAVEMADVPLVVTTPDVPAMRAANRLLGLWDRLGVRSEGIRTLVNRASRDSEIQTEMVGRIVEADTLDTVVPSSFWTLEAPANTGAADRLDEGPARAALDDLAAELALAPSRRRRRGGLAARRSETGFLSVEAAGILPIVLTVALLLWQMLLTGYTWVLGSNAAREAARAMAVAEAEGPELDAHLMDVVRGRTPALWHEDVEIDRDGETVTVRLAVPIVAPGMGSPFTLPAEASAPREVSRWQRLELAWAPPSAAEAGEAAGAKGG